MLQVAAPYYAARPSVVTELRVKEGDWVQTGQILAVLDGYGPTTAALRLSEARLAVARNHLAQVNAGAKPAEIAAHTAEVGRRQSELEDAEAEYKRFELLYRTKDVSASALDAKRTEMETARKALDQAREELQSVAEVRQTDINLASSEVDAAQAEVKHARADQELTLVRAPASGRILKIHVHPGEEAGVQSVLEMGRTDHMYATAEVYETDIGRVHLGQRATVTSDLFPGKLQGTVTEIGRQIAKSEVLPLDPAAFADARVVNVKVRLDDSKPVAGLINGKVTVRFEP